MKFVLSLSMLATLPILAIAVPLERSSEAIPQDVGKRQAACGGSNYPSRGGMCLICEPGIQWGVSCFDINRDGIVDPGECGQANCFA
ncbi:hypothetical protein AA0119_g13086 [Alternaria tenuissima]|uniref:EF-hand domain-containing protein n=2 Tax=Alternaria alternata complex TaxID=187734 RepID=A0A4Q4MZA8_ALTAL|nr:hypothetical protein AA0117_g12885 [Alternaria alternata]RYN85826.1 hypothetical protein AA0119_g13086 [Alternaria tenuissima]RYO11201.1 hypothetical protein AA0121_g10038 [Alternaria tenuissima]